LWFGWRANFFFLAAWGLVVIVIVAVWMPESNFRPDPTAMRPLQIFRNFRALLRNRSYLGHTLMMVFIFGAFFAFISGSPFVFIGILGIAPENFAPITLTITVLGFVMGTLLANNFSQHFGIERVLFAAVMLSAASGVVTAILPWLGVQSVASIIGPLAIFAFAAGFIFPLATAAAIGPFPHMAGAAASLLGFLESTVGATLGVLVGILHDGTVFPMTLVIGASTTTSFVVYLVFLWRRPIRPTDQLRSAQESNLRPPD
jgi:DHA1 family bicyclomycin/chloramphenicol resistance-like MFS transporter